MTKRKNTSRGCSSMAAPTPRPDDELQAALAYFGGDPTAVYDTTPRPFGDRAKPNQPSTAATFAELLREPIHPIGSHEYWDCGMCAVAAAAGLTYAQASVLDPRTADQKCAQDGERGLYAREMVKILAVAWPGSKWYVQPVGGRPLVSAYHLKPPRGILLTKDTYGFGGHWVAFCRPYSGAETYIADNDGGRLIPQGQYAGATISKLVAPSPSCTDEAVARTIGKAELLTRRG